MCWGWLAQMEKGSIHNFLPHRECVRITHHGFYKENLFAKMLEQQVFKICGYAPNMEMENLSLKQEISLSKSERSPNK